MVGPQAYSASYEFLQSPYATTEYETGNTPGCVIGKFRASGSQAGSELALPRPKSSRNQCTDAIAFPVQAS